MSHTDYMSPEVHPDRRVTFRLFAPEAGNVAVTGIRGLEPVSMTKAESGLWSVTLGPFAPEIYDYLVEVDGVEVLDPKNRRLKKWLNSESVFEVPGRPPLVHAMQAVPHGAIEHRWYPSAAVGTTREVFVYTPPGYDPCAPATYPVVYLMHGYGDDASAWTENGRVHWIADNLIAAGRLTPAIIVMPDGHPVPIDHRAKFDHYAVGNLEKLEADYFQDLMPFIESAYRLDRRPSSRALVGLSMGGGHALGIGLRHLDTFGWIGAFSAAVPQGDISRYFADLASAPKAVNARLRRLWIGCGKDDFLLQRNKEFVAWLNERGIEHTWLLSDGGHAWIVWRKYIAEFLPLLFRGES